jgi:hypothetical protein
VKAIWQISRAAFARALLGYLFARSRVRASTPRTVGACALASAMLFVSFSAAQALTGTSLTISASPTFTFTVTVSSATGTGTPTGTVTFSFVDNTTGATGTFGSPTTNPGPGTGQSQAILSTSALPAGNLTITATYSGDSNFSGSSISTPYAVQKQPAGTGISSSTAGQSTFGQSVTFTAIVSPTIPGSGPPSGTVTFTVNGTPVTTVTLSGGQASFTTSTLPIGHDNVTATYNGDNNFFGGTSGSVVQIVSAATPTPTMTAVASSQNPSTVGQTVTFTASVTGAGGIPTGTVTFTIDGNVGTPINLLNGAASTSTSTLTVAGSPHSVSATYSGDGTFAGSTGSLNPGQTVNNGAGTSTTTNVASSLNPTVFGQTATFTATVSGNGGTPTGTVTFTIDGSVGSPINLVNGAASTSTSTLTVAGSPHSVSAAYSGDGTFAGSTGSLAGGQTVNMANTTITLVSSQNPSAVFQGIGFTATVFAVAPGAGTPGGTVTFTIDGNVQPANTLTNGTVTFATPGLTAGSHTISVVYNGDPNFNKSGPATLTQKVVADASAVTVQSSANPSALNQAVTFTATIKGIGATGSPGSMCAAPITSAAPSATISKATRSMLSPD